jgi:hypothetical protein
MYHAVEIDTLNGYLVYVETNEATFEQLMGLLQPVMDLSDSWPIGQFRAGQPQPACPGNGPGNGEVKALKGRHRPCPNRESRCLSYRG